jgi:hypothetical protein
MGGGGWGWLRNWRSWYWFLMTRTWKLQTMKPSSLKGAVKLLRSSRDEVYRSKKWLSYNWYKFA